MSLHGSLETFALPDVLTLIASTRKTGELRVSGSKLVGSVWLDDGRIVETSVGKAPTFVDALFDLLRLTEGQFTFEAERAAPNPGDPSPVEPLLAETQTRLSQWKKIEAVIPSLDHVLELIADVQGPVTLRHEQWPLVVALAANRTPRAVLEALSVSEFDGCKALKELADAGLVKVGEPAPAEEPVKAKTEAAPAEAPAVQEAAEDTQAVEPPGVEATRDPNRTAASAAVGVSARIEETPGLSVMEAAIPNETPADGVAMAEALVRQLSTMEGDQGAKAKVRKAHAVETGRGAPARPDPTPGQPVAVPVAAGPVGTVPAADEAPEVAAVLAHADGAPDPVAVLAAAAGAEPAPEGDELGEVLAGDEPINRGLLLKFLSSVRS